MSDFTPRTTDEWSLREYLAKRNGSGGTTLSFVQVEEVVSGSGIANCYAWAVEAFGPTIQVDSEVDAEIRSSSEPASVIVKHGSTVSLLFNFN